MERSCGVRNRTAKIIMDISSYLAFFAKFVLPKEKSIIVVALPIPGVFIIHDCIIFEKPFKDKKLRGFEWEYQEMPEIYQRELRKIMGG
jgi:hypothetical protein